MMKVLIIGAHGKVGQIITKKMVESNDFEPTAFFRKEEQKSVFEKIGTNTVVASLESDIDSLAETIKGYDAVVFAAGSGGKTGDDKTLEIDLDGAVKSMDAAKKVGVNRFVIVSAIGADDRKIWNQFGIKPYYIAKHYADRLLISSGLDYTIVRPGALLDEPETGKITTTNPMDNKSVPRADVAQLILEALRNKSTICKIIEFNQGDIPIAEAI